MNQAAKVITKRMIAKSSVKVEVPAQFAFRYVVDIENMADWFPGVTSVSAVAVADGSAIATGKEYVEHVEVPLPFIGGVSEVPLKLIEVVDDKRLVLTGEYALLLPRSEMVFEPLSDGACQLYWRMDSRKNGNAIWRAAFPIAKLIMSVRGRQALQNLKSLLEQRYSALESTSASGV